MIAIVIRTIITTAALTLLWVILAEGFTWESVAFGLVAGVFVSLFSNKFMPKYPKRDTHVKLHKLITYPFWLIGKMYKDAFGLIKLIFTGGECGIVKEKLELEDEALRMVLASSVTITPGTITLEQESDSIVVLCIDKENTSSNFAESVENIRNIEKRLKRAETKKEKTER